MKRVLKFLFLCSLFSTALQAQEESPFMAYEVPAQNLLKFNRFLINPTFSTVQEDKSYINLLHRNQSVSFDDNNQTYFLSYSGRINDRTGLGLSLYTQRDGLLTNYGVLANYAYGIKLSEYSNFTFGANLSYYNSGFDEARATPVENDPFLNGFQDASLLTFQPGFNLSYKNFDFGMYAENLLDYNLKTSEALTAFSEKTFSGHLQYTHRFDKETGIFESGRLMPLARVRKVGEEELVLGGSLVLDLPKLGWVQGGYDSFYGASAGIGFNLNRRLSLGYTMEKGLSNNFENFGVTHELSFAYSFTPTLTEDRVMLEEGYTDQLVQADETDEPEEAGDKDARIAELERKLAENDAILAELMYRQDSTEKAQEKELERRFELVMRMVRREAMAGDSSLQREAKRLFYDPTSAEALVATNTKDLATRTQDSQVAVLKQPAPKNFIPKSMPGNTVASRDEVANPREVVKDIARTTPEKAEKYQSVQDDPAPAEGLPSRLSKSFRKRVVQEPRGELAQIRKDQVKAPQKDTLAPVKSRTFRDLDGIEAGHYLVVNVYKGEQYLKKFIAELAAQGIEADYVAHPTNGLKYVYIKRFEDQDAAFHAARTGLDGTYTGQTWVMQVEQQYANDAYVANKHKISRKAAAYEQDVLRKNVVVQDKLPAAKENPSPTAPAASDSGYYIIANVFANPHNANRFVRLLNSQGLSASYFINPKNNYRYVYLKRHQSWNNALVSYYSNLNDAYMDKMWIMRVTPNLVS